MSQTWRGRPTIAEVSTAALAHNFRCVRARLRPGVEILAVVKADAYGHGALGAARVFAAAGAAALGVATVEEGAELRAGGVEIPVVVLGGHVLGQEEALLAHRLTPVIWDLERARALDGAVARTGAGGPVPVHLKVDTGMGRLGLRPEELPEFARALQALRHLEVAGLCSHFANAEAVDTAVADAQLARFREAMAALAAAGIRPRHCHIANSAAVLSRPDAHFTMVRPGLVLYGIAPAPHLASVVRLQPAMRLRTTVLQLKQVPPGTPVSYGGTYVTRRQSRIGVLPIGYADGYWRSLSNRAAVLVRGRRAPVAGRVCMDHTMVDLTEVPGVQEGDDVWLWGPAEGPAIDAAEVAAWGGTIAYEVLTSVGKRVPRRMVESFSASSAVD